MIHFTKTKAYLLVPTILLVAHFVAAADNKVKDTYFAVPSSRKGKNVIALLQGVLTQLVQLDNIAKTIKVETKREVNLALGTLCFESQAVQTVIADLKKYVLSESANGVMGSKASKTYKTLKTLVGSRWCPKFITKQIIKHSLKKHLYEIASDELVCQRIAETLQDIFKLKVDMTLWKQCDSELPSPLDRIREFLATPNYFKVFTDLIRLCFVSFDPSTVDRHGCVVTPSTVVMDCNPEKLAELFTEDTSPCFDTFYEMMHQIFEDMKRVRLHYMSPDDFAKSYETKYGEKYDPSSFNQWLRERHLA